MAGTHSGLMAGKRGLIMGVANKHSIAWGIAKALADQGAEIDFSYQGEALKKRVDPLAALEHHAPRAAQGGRESLLLYGSPGLLPLLLDARTLRGILAEDEVGPQGGDGGDQGLLARLVPLQGWQGLAQQGLLGGFNPAELMVDKGGGENDEQIDKTEAQQQLA